MGWRRRRTVLARAVDLGSGYIGAGRHSNVEFIDLAARLREILAERGMPPGFQISKRVYIVVDDDLAQADRVVTEWFERFYNRPEFGARVTVSGSAAECADELSTLVAGGATHLLLHPLVEDPDQYDTLTSLVIPSVIDRSRPNG